MRVWMALARLIGTCFAVLLILSGTAAAEGFFDLAAGVAVENDASDLRVQGAGGRQELDLQDDVSFGVRGGYWFEGAARWLGLALDLSYFRSRSEDGGLKIHTLPLSPLLMLRAPLVASSEFPNGRLQPYVAAGPALTISAGRVEVPGDDNTDASFDVGADARAGVAVALTHGLAIFTEYRFTHTDLEFDDLLDVGGTPDVDVDLQRHHVRAGVSFRF